MKTLNQLILAASLLLCSLPVLAQSDGYRPMVRPGVKWVYSLMDVGQTGEPTCYIHISYEFSGEATFNGASEFNPVYMKCWRTIEDPKGRFSNEPVLVAYVREENKKVYAIYDENYIGKTRYFHNGYRDYDPARGGYGLTRFVYGGEDLATAFAGNPCWGSTSMDEYLIYDFNDIPTFYARHPELVYVFGKEFEGRPDDNVTIGMRYVTSEAEPVVISGREVKRYKLELQNHRGLTYYYATGVSAAPSTPGYISQQETGSESSGLATSYKDHTRYVLEGYGDVHNLVTYPSAAIAYSCRSFLSPMAMFRNPSKYWEIFGGSNAVFNFCHIEEDGQIVYKSDSCDYFEEQLDKQSQGGGDEPSGVGEVSVDGGAVDGRTYDMQGRVVSDPSAPGIYVRDGKKVLVK